MLGDKTRSRGTPLPVAIVRQPAANFIRNHFHIRSHVPLRCFHNRELADGHPRQASTLLMQGKGEIPFRFSAASRFPPSPAPHPPPKTADIHRPVASARLLKSN